MVSKEKALLLEPVPVSIPSGTVTFMEGTAELGSAKLDGKGNAWFKTTALGAGAHEIMAVYAGDHTHAGSSSDAFTQKVTKAPQAISFDPLADKVFGDAPFALGATSTSGLPVSFAIAGPASLAGTKVTLTGVGTVVVRASQAGDANYLPQHHRALRAG